MRFIICTLIACSFLFGQDTLYTTTGVRYFGRVVEQHDDYIMFQETTASSPQRVSAAIISRIGVFTGTYPSSIESINTGDVMDAPEQEKVGEGPKFSMGIQHTPFDLAAMFFSLFSGDDDFFNSTPATQIMFSQKLKANMRIIGSLGYTLTNQSSEQSYSFSGSASESNKQEYKIQLIDLRIGAKINQGVPAAKGMTSYVFAMVGKRFGSVTSKEIDSGYSSEDSNADELDKYQSQLMSPLVISGGAGAEYYFNPTLSLVIILNMDLYAVSGSYKYQEGSYSESRKQDSMTVNTLPMLGLNIYF